jgi:hypothetical protein
MQVIERVNAWLDKLLAEPPMGKPDCPRCLGKGQLYLRWTFMTGGFVTCPCVEEQPA